MFHSGGIFSVDIPRVHPCNAGAELTFQQPV
jgi:hypothetical protein